MSRGLLPVVFCAALAAACGASNGARVASPARTASGDASAALVANTLVCMLDHTGEDARCEGIARSLHVAPEAVYTASPEVVDLVTERVLAGLHADGRPLWHRVVLSRWLDLGASAIREATAARLGAPCVVAEDGVSVPRNAAALMRRDALDALFDEVPGALGFAGPLEASALLVLSHRLQTARTACGDAAQTASRGFHQLLVEQRSRHRAAATGGGPEASDAADDVDALGRSWIATRLTALEDELSDGALANAVERARNLPAGTD